MSDMMHPTSWGPQGRCKSRKSNNSPRPPHGRASSRDGVHQWLEQIRPSRFAIFLLLCAQWAAVSHTDQVQAWYHQKSLMSCAGSPECVFGKRGKPSICIGPPAHAISTRQSCTAGSKTGSIFANELRPFPVAIDAV